MRIVVSATDYAFTQSAWIALLLVLVLPIVMYAGYVPRAHSSNGARPKVFVGVRFLALMAQFLLTIALCAPGSKFPLASIAASILPDAAADASIVTLIDTDLRAYFNWYCAAAIILTLVELAGLALTCASLYGNGVDLFCACLFVWSAARHHSRLSAPVHTSDASPLTHCITPSAPALALAGAPQRSRRTCSGASQRCGG